MSIFDDINDLYRTKDADEIEKAKRTILNHIEEDSNYATTLYPDQNTTALSRFTTLSGKEYRDAEHAICKALLANGVDPNHADKIGKTPLHAVAMIRRADLAKIFIEGGADHKKLYRQRELGSLNTPAEIASKHKAPEFAKALTDPTNVEYWASALQEQQKREQEQEQKQKQRQEQKQEQEQEQEQQTITGSEAAPRLGHT